jgi:nucleotide-binding universal stress UspA family protein
MKRILVALDGSADSLAGGRLALDLAVGFEGRITALHVYDTAIHNTRFRQMEPGLPERYRGPESLHQLRREHDGLMSEGFKALSHGYLEPFLTEARRRAVPVTEVAVPGRNYPGILAQLREGEFDLVVLGATGLGAQEDGLLGSTVLRVLRRAPVDVLVARGAPARPRRSLIVAGIDGSPLAADAARQATAIAAALNWELELFAAYDTAFHRTIFRTMARSLSAGRQRETGLDRQEAVHEELIDKSLESLYGSFLKEAAGAAAVARPEVRSCLRPGKAYRALVDYGAESGAGLIVLGRYGHNYEAGSEIGSQAEAVVRLASCPVLISGGVASPAPGRGGEQA